MESLLHRSNGIQQIPFLLLVISCGISSGTLMIIALMLHIAVCYRNNTSFWGPIVSSRVFRHSLVFIAIFFGCSLLTIPFNDGNIVQLFKYMERAIPLLLVAIIARPDEMTFRIAWYGVLISLLFILLSVVQYLIWAGHRLFGPFSSPNTLAGLIVVMIPVALFGIIRYRKNSFYQVLLATFLTLISIVVMLCTGSRNAYGTFGLSFLLLLWFVYRYHDLISLRIMGIITVLSVIVVVSIAPSILTQRLDRNPQQDGRVYLMQSGLQLVEEHPIIGIGVGNWGKVYKERFEEDNPNHEKNIQSPHNIYLHIFNETGIIGLLGFLTLIIYQIKLLYASICQSYRMNSRAFPWSIGFGLSIISVYLFGLLDYDFFSRHMMQIYWLMWGMCLCTVYVANKEY